MRFALSDEQRAFSRALDALLTDAGVPDAARRWADGDPAPGRDLWRQLAGLGVTALCMPDAHGGLDAAPADAVVAFEAIGRHAVPGPYVESAVLAPVLLAAVRDEASLEGMADGSIIVTAAAPPMAPLALDAHAADRVLLVDGTALHSARTGDARASVDRSRLLFEASSGEELGSVEPGQVARALDAAVLACSAQLLGAGERVLADSVEYAGSRRQFGRAIGEYQAIKHALADIRVALDFARPLVYGAAVSLGAGSPDASRDVSAAKAAVSAAAYRASRTALQTHGAIGYTEEFDLGLWITKIRALVSAWGTAGFHRSRVLAAITAASPAPASLA
ncbi:acyl-CoA dehydrogenase [Actinomadura sp. WMMA1423]|uniref:acyl-CoA dehydrogenase n=1 Tax=Actinomadura sp. WMMA1423 TaxID=2591108 RepID=UPI0011475E95|nr:acyl-CoA dehydrogenase [Actinomadura sp. WMMA1423]